MKITALTRYKQGDLWAALRQAGWNQSEAARQAGISVFQFNMIINLKRRPTEAQANAIQLAFGRVGVYLDILSVWPEGFRGFEKAPMIEQTAEVEDKLLCEQTYRILLEPGRSQSVDFDVERLEEAMETLTPQQRKILDLRMGFLDGHCYTYEEIAQRRPVSRERIRQIEAIALRKLRHPVRLRMLTDRTLPVEDDTPELTNTPESTTVEP